MAGAKLTIYPTLVIGLGGTGTNVVRYAKRRFLRTWNKARSSRDTAEAIVELPTMLQALAVDTEPLVNEPGAEPLYHHEFSFLGRFDATRLVQNRKHHHPYLDWWQWNEQDVPLGYIHNGAKQLRPVGRLAFFRNYVLFRRALSDKLTAMNQTRYIEEAEEEGFDVAKDYRIVYIVSSLCGGTGAGMFLDAAHVVRHQVGSNASVVGIFMMPSVFENEIHSDLQRRRIRANAYAALRELNHFHSDPTFQMHYPSEQGLIPATPYRAFSQIFLVERTNAMGRTLSSKAAAEQMAAHFIHLTAFSHLNKLILGFDVNVTEERTASPAGQRRNFLSYSSFGVSSLVVPRTALWYYFAARAAQRLAYCAYSSEAIDLQGGYKIAYQMMIDDLRTKLGSFTPRENEIANLRLSVDEALKRLSDLRDSISRSEGALEDFFAIVYGHCQQVFTDQGLYGLQVLLKRMQLKPGDADFRPDDDLHSSAKRPNPFPNIPARNRRQLWLLQSPEQRAEERRNDIQRRSNQRAHAIWDALLTEIASYAQRLEKSVGDALAGQAELLDGFNDRVWQTASEIAPQRVTRRDSETSTLYDLETGAVGPEHLDAFWQASKALLDQDAQQAGGRRIATMMLNLFERLVQPHNALDGLIDDAAQRVLAYDDDLRQRVDAAFDVRNVIQAQQRAAHRPPNHRVNQAMDRLAPHAAVDGDTYYYSEANQEQTQLITVLPPAPPDKGAPDNADRQRAYEEALRNYTQFRTVESDDRDRVDAVHIVHGIPVAYLSSIPDLYRQYSGTEFDRRMLHLDPRWPTALNPLHPDEPAPTEPMPPSPSATGSPPDAGRATPSPNGADPSSGGPASASTPTSGTSAVSLAPDASDAASPASGAGRQPI